MVVRCQMLLVAAAALCGCSLIDASGGGSDRDSGGGADGAAEAGGDAAGSCRLVDDFEDGVIADEWVAFDEPDAAVVESGGAVRVTFSGAEAWAGYDLRDRIDFSEGEVRVEVTSAGGLYTGFDVCFGDQELELWIEDGDVLTGETYNTDTADDSTSVVYDPEAHRFLRIRASGGMVYWEASPDESNWESIHTQAAAFSLDDVTVTIEAAGSSGDPPAAFESFSATPTGCAQ
ncbi:MAG TPA: hypothetical protein VFU21_30775 [Kofleriaceae bacterium]|nr:hypothetical protein [Kofleriaceae bacterium]